MNADKLRHEFEHPDDHKLATLLGSLRRVEAPKNFDFRLRARLVSASRPNFHASRLSWFSAAAASLVFLIAIAGTLVFQNSKTPPNVVINQSIEAPASVTAPPAANDAASVDEAAVTSGSAIAADTESPASATRAAVVDLPLAGRKARSEAVVAAPRELAAANAAEPLTKSPDAQKAAPDGGGSVVRGLEPARTILPDGINPSVSNAKIAEKARSGYSLTVRDVLSTIGADVAFDRSGWRVQSVTRSSPAEKSGIRAGDIVESIDSSRLTRESTFSGAFSGRALKVRRGDAAIELKIQNK